MFLAISALLVFLPASLTWQPTLDQAQQMRAAGRLAEAEATLRQVTKVPGATEQERLHWRWLMGSTLFDQGAYAQAFPFYEGLARLAKANAALAAEGHLGVLQCWVAMREPASARSYAERLMASEFAALLPGLPKMLQAQLHAWMAYTGREASLAEALRLLESGPREDPQRTANALQVLAHATVRWSASHPEAAAAPLERARALLEDAWGQSRQMTQESPLLQLSLAQSQLSVARAQRNGKALERSVVRLLALLQAQPQIAPTVAAKICPDLWASTRGRKLRSLRQHAHGICAAFGTDPTMGSQAAVATGWQTPGNPAGMVDLHSLAK